MIYSIKVLMIYEFQCNGNFGFPNKTNLVNKLSEKLPISQYMLFIYLQTYGSAGELQIQFINYMSKAFWILYVGLGTGLPIFNTAF